jgi:hypothetical protein
MGWTPPRRPWCATVEACSSTGGGVHGGGSTVGLDLAKMVFQAHGADASGQVVFRKTLRRSKVLEFFAQLPRCIVAMEACAGAHHWAREIGRFGHAVRLIPPSYVKPFVKRQKNDSSDAEAICEAAQRPMRRGRQNQIGSMCSSARSPDMEPIRESHTGPRHLRPHPRPDRCQHPDLAPTSQIPLAPAGASTDAPRPHGSALQVRTG